MKSKKWNHRRAKQRYQANIPKCCIYRTFREHWEKLALCEGVKAGVAKRRDRCICDCSRDEADRAEFRRIMKEAIK